MAKEIPTLIATGFLGKAPVVWKQKILRVFEIDHKTIVLTKNKPQ
jgi:hypothetical protein